MLSEDNFIGFKLGAVSGTFICNQLAIAAAKAGKALAMIIVDKKDNNQKAHSHPLQALMII